jgi:hypothetical protein
VQLISDSSQDPGVLHQALVALSEVCYGDSADIRQQAAAAGAVEVLVQLIISSSQDTEVLKCSMRRAAAALDSICSGDSADIQQRAAAAGAVEALVQLIRSDSSQDSAVLGPAVAALTGICRGDIEIRQRAAAVGAVEALVPLIGGSSSQVPGVLHQAAAALGLMCCSDSRQRAAAAGALEALVRLISASSQDPRRSGQCGQGTAECLQQRQRRHQAAGCSCRDCGSAGADHWQQ